MYINKKQFGYFMIFYTMGILLLIAIIPQRIIKNQNGTPNTSIAISNNDSIVLPKLLEEKSLINTRYQEQTQQRIDALVKRLELLNNKLAYITEIMELENVEQVGNIPEFSQEDIDLLARVTMSESSVEPYDTKVAVAQTVLNRLHSGKFGDTIEEIVYTKSQFSTSDNGDPTDEVYQAVQEAIDNPPHPSNMFYFRDWYYHKWAVDYKKIGGMCFSLDS